MHDLATLLSRNLEQIKLDTKLVICGQIESCDFLPLFKNYSSVTFIYDNVQHYSHAKALFEEDYIVAEDKCEEVFNYKNYTLILSPLSHLQQYLQPTDTIIMLLPKSKLYAQELFTTFNPFLQQGSTIYIAGANNAGGKSADKLLTCSAKPYKVDMARKCTLFAANFEQEFTAFAADTLKFNFMAQDYELYQDPAVFSYLKFDQGTKLLLENLDLKMFKPSSTILDLGCGCGIISLFLLENYCGELTSSDISVTALDLTKRNLEARGFKSKLYACNMLDGLGKFDVIISNPPFHDGLNTSIGRTKLMLQEVKDHLKDGGKLIIVGNTFLHYEHVLSEVFPQVQILQATTKFTVLQASI